MLRLCLILFIIHFSLFVIHSQDVSFYKENITMKIENDNFQVTGDYFLKTTNDTSIILFYPFPVDSLYGEADSIIIININKNNSEEVEILSQKKIGVIFRADFGNEKEIHILISYRQKLLGNKAEYILKTTAGWRKPLEIADYQLIVAPGIEIVDFSMPPDSFMETGEEKIY